MQAYQQKVQGGQVSAAAPLTAESLASQGDEVEGTGAKGAKKKAKRAEAAMAQMVNFEADFAANGEMAQMSGYTYTCDSNGNIVQKTFVNG